MKLSMATEGEEAENGQRIRKKELPEEFMFSSEEASLKESYMWVSPMPREILSAYKLEEKICADGNRQCLDVLVYREGSIRTVWEKLFLEELRRVKEELLLV